MNTAYHDDNSQDAEPDKTPLECIEAALRLPLNDTMLESDRWAHYGLLQGASDVELRALIQHLQLMMDDAKQERDEREYKVRGAY